VLGFGVESVVDVHIGEDFVRGFDEVVAHLVGGDFGKAKVGFGVDEAGVDGHAFGVDDGGAFGDFDGSGGAGGGDLAVLHEEDAVFDGAVGDGEEFATDDGGDAGFGGRVDHDGLGECGCGEEGEDGREFRHTFLGDLH
jgi:hypothetical protein